MWIEQPPDKAAGETYGKKFIPCRFGITDGTYTEVVAVLGGNQLSEGERVYTKLPRDPDEEERRRQRSFLWVTQFPKT